MNQITQKQPVPLKKLRKDIPPGLRGIVQKLLHKNPDKRFQTGGQLAKALIRELVAIREQEEEKDKDKYVPLKVRWAILMGGIVAVVLLISMSVVFSFQSQTMTEQAVDTGELFTKFIANDLAIDVLQEDWIKLDTTINDENSLETFKYLTILDHDEIIQVATDQTLVGQKYKANENAELINENEDVRTTNVVLDDGSQVFNISAPIKFQNTKVGTVILGLSQDSLDNVKSVTVWLMFALAIVTISAVVLMIYIFGAMLAKPFKMIGRSLKSFNEGNYDTRISTVRNDEIGELFKAFDDMASNIQIVIVGKDDVKEINSSDKGEDKKHSKKEQVNKEQKGQVKKKETKKASTKKKATKKPSKTTKKKEKEKEEAEEQAALSEVNVEDDATIISSIFINKQSDTNSPSDNDKTIIAPAIKSSKDSEE